MFNYASCVYDILLSTFHLISMYPTYRPVSHEAQVIILNLICVNFIYCLVLNQLDTWFECVDFRIHKFVWCKKHVTLCICTQI